MNGRQVFAGLALVALAMVLSAGTADAAYIEAGKIVDIQDDYTVLPSEVFVGDTVSLSVNLYNKGKVNMAKDLEAELVLTDHFEAINVTDEIDNIRPEITQTVLFKFRVKEDTSPGAYTLTIRIGYTSVNMTAEGIDPENVVDTKTVTISVGRAKKNIEMEVEPNVLFPGRKVDVDFRLKNTGDSRLSNINFSWTEANSLILPIGSDNRRYLSALAPGEEGVVSFTVAADPNIVPGVYSFDSTLTYNDESASTNTLEAKIGFIVGGTTDFDVSLQETGSDQVSLSIANVGSNNAEGVVVRIPQQESFSTQGFDTAVLGNLNRGDFTIASFRIVSMLAGEAGAQAQGDGFAGVRRRVAAGTGGAAGDARFADLKVEISYTDTTGERQTVEKTVHFLPQSLYQGTEGTGTAAANRGLVNSQRQGIDPLVALVVIAVVAGGAYLYWRRRQAAAKGRA